MTINGLDISVYQEQPQYGKLIDWVALKNDPLNFRFIWIKIAEGTGVDNYPIEDVKRQLKGAQSVKFEAINPYHFYWYQEYVPSLSKWVVISAIAQAQTFFDATVKSNFPVLHPMVDLEDPLIDQFLQWNDTASANKAITFARGLAKHIKLYLETITQLFQVKPDCYSGWWWLKKWVPLLVLNGYASEVAFLNDYKWILADYDGELNYPDYIIAKENVIAWQRTSTPKPPVKGIPTGHSVPGDALDVDQWMLSDAKFLEWSNQIIGGNVSNTYNQSVAQLDRATFVVLSGDDKQVDMAGVASGTDAVMLKMGGQDVKEGSPYADSAFPIRSNQVSIVPVLGWFNLDANYPLWVRQFNYAPFTSRNWFENETLKILLNQWRKNGISDIEWNNHNLNISATDGKWNNLNGLVFYMNNTKTNASSDIPGMWQLATLDDMIKFLNIFMQGNYIPKVPIYLICTPEFFKKYDVDDSWKTGIFNRVSSGQLTGIGMIQVGSFTEVPMATPFTMVSEIFKFAPQDSFNYSFIPYGMNDKTMFHIYSYNRFLAEPVKTNNVCTPIMVGRWCDTVEVMDKVLNFKENPIVPPTPDPQPDPDLVARIEALESDVVALEDRVKKLEDFARSIPKFE